MNLSGIHLPTVVVALLGFVVLFFVLHMVAHR